MQTNKVVQKKMFDRKIRYVWTEEKIATGFHFGKYRKSWPVWENVKETQFDNLKRSQKETSSVKKNQKNN